MKDHFKFGVVYLNNKQVIDLENMVQIHTNVSNFEMAPPNSKPYEPSKFFSFQ